MAPLTLSMGATVEGYYETRLDYCLLSEKRTCPSHNPPYGKRWLLYILLQYLANLTEPLAHIESHILAKFIPVLTTLCMQGLEISEFSVCFYERFYDFRSL